MLILSSLGLITLIALIFIFIVAITILVEKDLGSLATLLILAVCSFIAYYDWPTVKYVTTVVKENVFLFSATVFFYIIFGVFYSFLRWYYFVKNMRKRYTNISVSPPKASEYAADIIRWISYWPFSLVWNLINEPIKKLFNLLIGRYNSLTQAAWESN